MILAMQVNGFIIPSKVQTKTPVKIHFYNNAQLHILTSVL